MTKQVVTLAIFIYFGFSFFNLGYAQEVAPSAQAVSRVIEDGGTGAYKALMRMESTLPTHTVFSPSDLKAFSKGHKLPIIAWGNGACYNSPWEHVNFLNEVASHGFLVIAIGVMP